MKSTIFLSYSSPQSEVALRIELALEADGHSVFRDRTDLPPGESFDARIRIAIKDKPQFLAALPPADHLATFRWLFPEDQLPTGRKHLYLYILAQLQELNGDRSNALASYRRLRSELGNQQGRLLDDSDAAIKRLAN